MRYRQTPEGLIVLCIDRGEDAFASLVSVCTEQNIAAATLSGIGAAEFLRVGYYALSEKKYHFTEYDELVEAATLTGNVTRKDEKPFVHMHGIFTGTDNKAFGGHIDAMRAGVVLEIILTPLSSAIVRIPDDETGLSLMDLSDTHS